MFEANWFLFLVASVAVIATPGQDMMLVMSRSIAQGARAGVVSAAGVSVGLVGHTLLAAAGLGAVLRASEWLFTGIKLVGAAYLMYLGVQLLRSKAHQLNMQTTQSRPLPRVFLDGALSNLMNPKIAIFYFAFLPQFVLPNAAQPTFTIISLGLTFAALTFLMKAPVGLGAGYLSGWLRARSGVLKWINRTCGAVMIGLGVRLALERRA
jgi:threonine/homoserine/homoserine lactone efflux protein